MLTEPGENRERESKRTNGEIKLIYTSHVTLRQKEAKDEPKEGYDLEQFTS